MKVAIRRLPVWMAVAGCMILMLTPFSWARGPEGPAIAAHSASRSTGPSAGPSSPVPSADPAIPAAAIVTLRPHPPSEADPPWYRQGRFRPSVRIPIAVHNPSDHSRPAEPVAVPRSLFGNLDVHELDVTLVDPAGEPRGEPSRERLARFGYHEIREEQNGRMVFHQLDDLDKDGRWDELFFQVDLGPGQTRVFHLYLGFNDRGWNPHGSTAGIGNYSRHLIAFWESEHVGWKLWYPTDVDVYAKREPQLMSQTMVMENLDGYGVDAGMGSDIMSVGRTFGGGGIALLEDPADSLAVSRPRFTPARERIGRRAAFNGGQRSDARYSFDVIVNGPLRSMVRVTTHDWDTGQGVYSLHQTYTAYARASYSRVQVDFTRFEPRWPGTQAAVGIRVHPNEERREAGPTRILTAGSERIVNPDDVDRIQQMLVEFTAHALHVPHRYAPAYRFTPYDTGTDSSDTGNHLFRVEPERTSSGLPRFEYYIASAWSEGRAFATLDAFAQEVRALESRSDHPVRPQVMPPEFREGARQPDPAPYGLGNGYLPPGSPSSEPRTPPSP